MHNYQVPTKYHHKTRLGNWSEEWELEETKMKDYLKKKDHLSLESNKKDLKLYHSLQQASLTYSHDGFLHFGDHVMIRNHQTNGTLSCDIWDKISGTEEAYAVTTSRNSDPCSRSVFILQRYDKERDLFTDNTIHYGQKFRVAVNSRLSDKQLFLHSLPVSPQRCSKFSRHQEVSVIAKDVFNTVWVFEYADPKVRFEMGGQPIRANEPVLIKHCFTSQWLASDNVPYRNDFGEEFEVFGHSFQHHNKTQNLIAEKTGRTTIDIPLRNQNPQNVWTVLTAQDKSQEFDESILDKTNSVESLLTKLKHQMIQRGT